MKLGGNAHMSKKRAYSIEDTTTQRWLYDWVVDEKTGERFPAWTHDRSKAMLLDAFEAAGMVSTARSRGHPGAVRVRRTDI
jgi:hypothetical protein